MRWYFEEMGLVGVLDRWKGIGYIYFWDIGSKVVVIFGFRVCGWVDSRFCLVCMCFFVIYS